MLSLPYQKRALIVSPRPCSVFHSQMRFQQRQQQERDQRKIEQIATRTTAAVGTVAIASSNGGRTTTTTTTTTSSSAVSATVELAERLNATTLSSSLGAGKVRQMFDERRHRVAGIDKSYPLQPIQSTATVPVAHGNHPVNGNNNSNSNGSTTNGSSTSGNDGGGSGSLARGMAKAGLNNKPRVPPISASSRTRLMQQQSQARGPNLRQDSLVAMQVCVKAGTMDQGKRVFLGCKGACGRNTAIQAMLKNAGNYGELLRCVSPASAKWG